MTAYHEGFETICTVRLWLCKVFDSPDFSRRSNLKCFGAPGTPGRGPRMGSGSDSVTSVRRTRIGSMPSSPSEIRLVEPTAL